MEDAEVTLEMKVPASLLHPTLEESFCVNPIVPDYDFPPPYKTMLMVSECELSRLLFRKDPAASF